MTDYLVFERGEADDGVCHWDALASPAAVHSQGLLAATSHLLQSLHRRFGEPGALDDGHAWDFDLQVHDEQDKERPWSWSGAGGGLHWLAPPGPDTRLTLFLSVCTTADLHPAFDNLLSEPPAP